MLRVSVCGTQILVLSIESFFSPPFLVFSSSTESREDSSAFNDHTRRNKKENS